MSTDDWREKAINYADHNFRNSQRFGTGDYINCLLDYIEHNLLNQQPLNSVEQEDAIWDLLKYLKQHHYLPQTESTLQEITKQYLQQLKEK